MPLKRILIIASCLLLLACPPPRKYLLIQVDNSAPKKEIKLINNDKELKIKGSTMNWGTVDQFDLEIEIKGITDVDSCYFADNIRLISKIPGKPRIELSEYKKVNYYCWTIEHEYYGEMTLEEFNHYLDLYDITIYIENIFDRPYKIIVKADREAKINEYMQRHHKDQD